MIDRSFYSFYPLIYKAVNLTLDHLLHVTYLNWRFGFVFLLLFITVGLLKLISFLFFY